MQIEITLLSENVGLLQTCAMASSPVQAFLQHLSRDPRLQARVQAAITVDEVAMLAQELGYAVTGSDLLCSMASRKQVRVTALIIRGISAVSLKRDGEGASSRGAGTPSACRRRSSNRSCLSFSVFFVFSPSVQCCG